MTQYVVDVCVAVKWFVPEIFSQEAARLLSGSHRLLAPDYLLPEAGNVFWKKIRFNEISLDEGQQA
jgi:predicted nucleic acid-binding protein